MVASIDVQYNDLPHEISETHEVTAVPQVKVFRKGHK